jgi:peptidoglycan/xylan/chitin deacetylase (PgdA/CDA1 family)
VLITFDDGYRNTVEVARPVLDRYQLPALLAVCGGYTSPEHLPRHTPHPVQEFATAQDIAAWRAAGRDIAAHSFSHQRLPDLSPAALRWQLDVDREVLTDILGEPPSTFVYPFGARDGRIRDAVSRRYTMAMTTDSSQPPSAARPYDVPRIQVGSGWDLAAFRTALAADAPPATAARLADLDLAARRPVPPVPDGPAPDPRATAHPRSHA